MIGRTVEELEVGQVVEVSRVVRRWDIADFVTSIGDRNPIHSDPAFAAMTSFREPIAPGVWTAGLVSAVIGTCLPGPGSIYVSQDLRFLKPVRIGETITARVEVVEVNRGRNRVRLKTTCVNQTREEVLAGEASVAPPKQAVRYAEGPVGPEAWSASVLQPWSHAAQAMSLWWRLGASALAFALPPGRKTTCGVGSP